VDLENIVREEMKHFFGQSEKIASRLQAADKIWRKNPPCWQPISGRFRKVREEMHQTHQLYLQKQISGDGFRDLYTPAEERMKQLNAELPRLEAEVDS